MHYTSDGHKLTEKKLTFSLTNFFSYAKRLTVSSEN